jgi:F-type H+-transporting ATPase subunit epsilon
MALEVEVVSPEKVLLHGEATSVVARTMGGGDIAFMPGHAPFLGALDTWTVLVHLSDGRDSRVAVHGGFVSVMNDRVTILSDLAEVEDQIDVARAERARDTAEQSLRHGEDVEAEADLRRAQARLQTVTPS